MSMTGNEDPGASSMTFFETCNNDGPVPWSDLNHDVLYLVIMQLEVVDFLAFSGVCKSWRSLALSKRNTFIMSRRPLAISIPAKSNKKDFYCYLHESGGRRFKTILLHSVDMTCVGFTCGYMVLFGSKSHDFWLANPITRHQLHFPAIPFLESDKQRRIMAVLVFSPSRSELVFVILNMSTGKTFFSETGTGAWNHVTSTFFIEDRHVFKGKIYTIVTGCHLCELNLDPEPRLTLLKTNNCPNPYIRLMKFLSSGENLYVMGCSSQNPDEVVVHELDFSDMKWVLPREEFAPFVSNFMNGFVIEPETWADPRSQYERCTSFLDTLLQLEWQISFGGKRVYFLHGFQSHTGF